MDGYCWPAVGIREWGWEKQTKYVVEPGFYTGPNPLVMNLKIRGTRFPRSSRIYHGGCQRGGRKTVAFYEEQEKKEMRSLKKAGLQVIDLPPAEKEKFLKSPTTKAGKTL